MLSTLFPVLHATTAATGLVTHVVLLLFVSRYFLKFGRDRVSVWRSIMRVTPADESRVFLYSFAASCCADGPHGGAAAGTRRSTLNTRSSTC